MLSLSAAGASASHVGEEAIADQQAIQQTNLLLASLRQYEGAAPTANAAALERLVRQAAARRERLLALMERNPKLAALRVLPALVRERLPAPAQAQTEREVALTVLVQAVVAGDVARGWSRTDYIASDAAGNRYQLVWADGEDRDMPTLSGKRALIAAVQLDRKLLVRQRRDVQLLAADAGASGPAASTSVAAPIQGTQKTLSVLLNFSDAPVSCTSADVSNRLFGATGYTVNSNYLESSRGQVSFTGQVIGPLNIDYSATGACNYLGWAAAADAAARAAGVDPSQFARVNYVTPANASCGWTGLAYMPGRQSWVQACALTGAFSHELGHNLGLNHAATPTLEYGDSSDPMGGGNISGHNAPNRIMAGWMPAGAVLDVSSGGSYALANLSTATLNGAPQVLRLVKADSNESYYVSMRRAQNLDARLPTKFIDALSIHRSTGAGSAKTYLLATVPVGQSFSDAANGITITHQGQLDGTATVGVAIGGAACTRQAPAVTVAPASQAAGAGTAVSYAVSVTNTNSAACGTSAFQLAQVMPAGIGGSFGTPSLSLAPGASGSTTWLVTPGAATVEATYTLTARAVDGTGGGSSEAHAGLVVSAPAATCTRTAPALSAAPAAQSGSAGATLDYALTLTNRNSSACGASTFNLAQALPSGFTGSLAPSATVSPGNSVSLAWKVASPATGIAGAYASTATAVETAAALPASATVTTTLTAPSDTVAPTVALTSPGAGAVLSGRSTVISASASDASGIRAVEFYVDGRLLATDTAAPFAANWNLRRATKGSHQVRVRALDNAGNAAEQVIGVTLQ